MAACNSALRSNVARTCPRTASPMATIDALSRAMEMHGASSQVDGVVRIELGHRVGGGDLGRSVQVLPDRPVRKRCPLNACRQKMFTMRNICANVAILRFFLGGQMERVYRLASSLGFPKSGVEWLRRHRLLLIIILAAASWALVALAFYLISQGIGALVSPTESAFNSGL